MDDAGQTSNADADKAVLDSDLARDDHTYAEVIALSRRLARQARPGRPNFQDMSLMARCLERANFDGGHEEFAADLHHDFRELFLYGDPDSESFATGFNAALQALQQDVFENPQLVLTIFSKLADTTLIKYFQPDWIMSDDIGANKNRNFCANRL